MSSGPCVHNSLRVGPYKYVMDPASLAAAMVAAQMSRVQMAAAATMMRMNADAANSVVQVVQAAEQNASQLANAAAGLGQNLNISV